MALLPLAFQDQQQAEPLFYSQPTHEVHLLLQQLEMKGCFSFFFQEVWLEASLEYLSEGLYSALSSVSGIELIFLLLPSFQEPCSKLAKLRLLFFPNLLELL